MTPLLVTLHVIISILLIGAILLQPGAKGGGLGASLGGGGANSAFGARGSAPFLAKATYWLGAGFLAACLLIEVAVVVQNRSAIEKLQGTKSAVPAPGSQPVSPSK